MQQEVTNKSGIKSIDAINKNITNGRRFFSFEYYPPRTAKGVETLKKSISNMVKWQPQWMDVTWGAGGTTSDLTPEICDYIQNTANGNCMMHLTCTNMPSEKVDIALKKAKDLNLKNILALRGDPPEGQKRWAAVKGGFECALDLIKYIKAKYGDYFGITVSGYPEGHPVVRKVIDSKNWNVQKNEPKYYAIRKLENGKYEGVCEQDWLKELDYLKAKIEAGGQVIITQLFYDAQMFIDWVKAVRKHGITAPVLPGIMPIRNFGSFKRMTGFCKTIIPNALNTELQRLKNDGQKLYEYGGKYVSEMCQKVLSAKDQNGKYLVPGLHIYKMNTEKCTIELLAKCKIGFDKDEKMQNLINNELKRVLKEDEQKKIDKLNKQREILMKPTQIDEGKFQPVTSF